jgi:hypothetical protein
MPRLTLLAPDIVEMILGRQQSAQMTLAGLMRPFAVGWTEHRKSISVARILRSSAPRRTQDDVEFQSKSSIL